MAWAYSFITFLTCLWIIDNIWFVKAQLTKPSDEVDVGKKLFKVHGPGLRPDQLVLPVQYFFIEPYQSNGERVKISLGIDIKVKIEGETSDGLSCRIWVQVLDRKDGTYIVRYRVYQTCYGLTIQVFYKYKHVAESPYKIQGPVYSEYCKCTVGSLEEWTVLAGCPDQYEQIKQNLDPFQQVNMDEVLEETVRRLYAPEARSFCNFVIKENELYKNCYGKYVGFAMFMENIILSMTKKMVFPDVEFIVNLGDWPIAEKKVSPPLPIFAWCSTDNHFDILLPTYELTQATLEMLAGVTIDTISVQGNDPLPWAEKKPMGFFRGRDSSQTRLDLVILSRSLPDLINASITNFFFFKDQQDIYGPRVQHESFFKFFDNKYQVSMDGTVAAYRFPFLLAGSSLVFKQDSQYYEHFYRMLKPYVHYIPFKKDLSDLVDKLIWAKENDEKAQEIAQNARLFVEENLLPKEVFCYHARLFQEWTKRVVSPVRVRPSMNHTVNEENVKRFGDCRCHRNQKREEL